MNDSQPGSKSIEKPEQSQSLATNKQEASMNGREQWTAQIMTNMKRMAMDEAYRLEIAKQLS